MWPFASDGELWKYCYEPHQRAQLFFARDVCDFLGKRQATGSACQAQIGWRAVVAWITVSSVILFLQARSSTPFPKDLSSLLPACRGRLGPETLASRRASRRARVSSLA